MKRRWQVLFWISLASLIGVSWLAHRLGVGFMGLMNFGLAGMMIASAVSFVAMIKNIQSKWPAAIALICAGPWALDTLPALPHMIQLVSFIGPSIALAVVGNVAAIVTAIVILVSARPEPPPPPPIAPARVAR